MNDSNTALKTFKYRLYPTRSQERNLWVLLDTARAFYNHCIEERKWAYQLQQRSVSRRDQQHDIKHYKRTFPQARPVHTHILLVVTYDVQRAFEGFFRRVKTGETPGYPRFKGRNHFHSFGFAEYGNGFRLDGQRLKVSGVGRIAVRWHRPIEGEIRTVRIVHQAGKWYACFACGVPESEPLPATGKGVGIDVGISALITTSDGEKVENPNYYRAAQKKLRVLQRKLARAQRGSNNRKQALRAVQRQQERVANQRRDTLNKLTYQLVTQYDQIAVEDLRITNMVKNKHLSKSILDSGWGYFKERLTIKAAKAGRGIAFVNPAYTSQDCSTFGCSYRNRALTLSDREWVCPQCHTPHDRDINAAINILKRTGWVTALPDNVTPLPVPNLFGHGKRKRPSEATRLEPL